MIDIEKIKTGIIFIAFLNKENAFLGSGTGFLCNGFLITNGHVVIGHNTAETVILMFYDDNQGKELKISYKNFLKKLKNSSEENSYDYAIFEIEELKKLYQFKLSKRVNNKLGEKVYFLGFPFSKNNIVLHQGHISSLYSNSMVDVIQIDASVNSGNSGGPLLNYESGEVIGIITRKESGLNKMFDELKSAIIYNIDFFEKMHDGVIMSGVSFKESALITQRQMFGVVEQIERSANVGIGYAFSIKHILEHNNYLE